MELAQNLITPLVLVFLGTIGAYLLKERLDRFEARLDALPTREEMNARFAANDARFDGLEGRMDRLEAEVAVLRSDLTQIALAVGARLRPQTG